jgi:AcrR family transcriptional regulator
MPYPSGHREQVRHRIVESARGLFNRSGFETVSVDSIMAHAGRQHRVPEPPPRSEGVPRGKIKASSEESVSH